MSAVKQLHDMTKRIYQKLTQSTQGKDREQLITEITSFLEEREELMKQVQPPYTEEELTLGKELVQMDQEIQGSLQELMTNLKSTMRQLQNQKRNNTKYRNPYQNVGTSDGMFFDKKN
jgi:flagellar protein FliT